MTYWAIQTDRDLFMKSVHVDATVIVERWRRNTPDSCHIEYVYRVQETNTGRDWGWKYTECVPCTWVEHPVFVDEGHFRVIEEVDLKTVFNELLKNGQKMKRIFGHGDAWR